MKLIELAEWPVDHISRFICPRHFQYKFLQQDCKRLGGGREGVLPKNSVTLMKNNEMGEIMVIVVG